MITKADGPVYTVWFSTPNEDNPRKREILAGHGIVLRAKSEEQAKKKARKEIKETYWLVLAKARVDHATLSPEYEENPSLNEKQ